MQNAESGNYSYVEDYTNSSSTEIAIRQKIGIIGGELSVRFPFELSTANFPTIEIVLGQNPVYTIIHSLLSDDFITTRNNGIYNMTTQ